MSEYEPLKKRVESVIQLAMAIVTPLSGGEKSLSLSDHRTKRTALDPASVKEEVEVEV